MAIEQRRARLEGIMEQIDRRLENLERKVAALADRKSDNWKTRL